MSTEIHEAQAGLNAVLERFRAPEAARRTLAIGAELTGGLRMDVDIRGHRITVDEPKGLGGTDGGPSPVELALAALMTCQAITYRMWATKLGIVLDSVSVQVEGDIDLRGFLGIDEGVRPGFSTIRLRVTLDGPEPPERYRELTEAVDTHCPVLDLAGSAVPIERTIV